MRQTLVSGLVAAAALVAVTASPAMACGGWYATGCAPCGSAYVVAAPMPCGGAGYYAQPGYYDFGGVAEYERLPDPSPQYFYVDQGPVYSGPGMFAPARYYREATVSRGGYGYRHHHRYHHRHVHGYRHGYGPHHYAPRYGHAPRHGAYRAAPRGHGQHR